MNAFSRLWLLPALLLMFMVSVVLADAYTATVPVEDYSDHAREQGIRDGLLKVMVRMTGDSAIEEDPRIGELLDQVDRYVQEYGYTTLSESESGDGTRPGLTVAFSSAAIDRFLRSARLPVLPSNRPDLMVWVVADDLRRGRHFLTRDDRESFFEDLETIAAERGFSLSFPLLDLEDQLTLDANQAWHLDEEATRRASARYGADFWLVLRLYRTSDGQWRGAWLADEGQGASLHQTVASDLPQLAEQVVTPTLDRMAANLAFVPDGRSGNLLLTVDQVRSLPDYRRLVAELEGSALVTRVRLREITADRVLMDLVVEGDSGQVTAALGRNPRLRQQAESSSGHAMFQWLPLP